MSDIKERLRAIYVEGHPDAKETYERERYESADRIDELESEIEAARSYLVRNVLVPANASPLNGLMDVCTQVDNITSEIHHLRAMTEWQPIETMPQKGEGQFLAYNEGRKTWLQVFRQPKFMGEYRVTEPWGGLTFTPRAWMPLPTPPTE